MLSFHIIKNRNEIKAILDTIKFDFAFIDGEHNNSIRADFELVKKCKRVLFHDVDYTGICNTMPSRKSGTQLYPESNKFMHEIGAKFIYNNIGYWKEVK